MGIEPINNRKLLQIKCENTQNMQCTINRDAHMIHPYSFKLLSVICDTASRINRVMCTPRDFAVLVNNL